MFGMKTFLFLCLAMSSVFGELVLEDLSPYYRSRIQQLKAQEPLLSIRGVQQRLHEFTNYLGLTDEIEDNSTIYITNLQGDDGIVQVIFDSSITSGSDTAEAFVDAADFWNQVIGGTSLVTASSSDPASICGLEASDFPGTPTNFDSIIIFATVGPIDGVGRTLGQAGPCATLQGFPRLGLMNFDSADVASLLNDGSFDEVVKHEMGHVVGIGTLWAGNNLVKNPCNGANPCNTNPTFTGSNGIEGFQDLGGTGELPVADLNGAGTADGHWRESTFQNELMTGFLSPGENPMSIMSVKSLKDLGYTVNVNAAEDYQIPGSSSTITGTEVGNDAGYPGGIDDSQTKISAVESNGFATFGIIIGAVIAIAVAGLILVQRYVSNRKAIQRNKKWMENQPQQPIQAQPV